VSQFEPEDENDKWDRKLEEWEAEGNAEWEAAEEVEAQAYLAAVDQDEAGL
jgi:hypothetical protein